ncbi:MAG TPA: Rap1a/Tai family immunity protein [Burkholderiales bacterium]|nr:Rap1a/Tai family immunity protein [Burkholderiales bacterium]
MPALLAAGACAIAGSAAAADTQRFELRNVADLVAVCSVPEGDPHHAIAMGFCHGVLVGAYGYYDSAVAKSDRFVCSPTPTPKRSQVMNGFVTWARAHPGYAKQHPVDGLFKYLAETYPCRK